MTRLAWLSLSFLLCLKVQGQEAAPAVDHHQHLFGPATVARSPSVPLVTARELVRLLDEAGIQRAAVFSVAYQWSNPNNPPVADEYARVRAENDWTSQQAAAFPDRLRAFCSVNPLKEYALEEIDRCAKDPQLRVGLKLHFGNSDVDLDKPDHVDKVRQVFRAADGHRMAIVVHLRSSVTRKRPYGAAQAKVFLDSVLPAAPHVPVQIAHLAGAGGYDDPAMDEAVGVFADAMHANDSRVARVYFDISGVVDGNWQEKADRIATRIRQLGLDRVLYGSDGAASPKYSPRQRLADYRQLPLTAAEFRVLANNVAPYMR